MSFYHRNLYEFFPTKKTLKKFYNKKHKKTKKTKLIFHHKEQINI